MTSAVIHNDCNLSKQFQSKTLKIDVSDLQKGS